MDTFSTVVVILNAMAEMCSIGFPLIKSIKVMSSRLPSLNAWNLEGGCCDLHV